MKIVLIVLAVLALGALVKKIIGYVRVKHREKYLKFLSGPYHCNYCDCWYSNESFRYCSICGRELTYNKNSDKFAGNIFDL